MYSPSIIIGKNGSCDRLILFDASTYGTGPLEEVILEIKAPNSCCFVTIPVSLKWCSVTIDYTGLGLNCTADSACGADIPDGVYEIRYTINGIEALYYHLRTCKLWKQYIQKACELKNSTCVGSTKFKNSLTELYFLRNSILDAEITAQDCLDPEGAMEMYNYIKEKLNGSGCMC